MFKNIFFFLIIVNIATPLTAGEIADRSSKIIRDAFGDQADFEFQKVKLIQPVKTNAEKAAGQRFYSDFLFAAAIRQDDKVSGYAVMDNVKGKAMPITFIVLFDTAGNIASSHVVKYRETIGGEIAHPGWLSQFNGKSSSSSYKLGSDIDGISGATISSRAMTSGINKLTHIFDFIIGIL